MNDEELTNEKIEICDLLITKILENTQFINPTIIVEETVHFFCYFIYRSLMDSHPSPGVTADKVINECFDRMRWFVNTCENEVSLEMKFLMLDKMNSMIEQYKK